MGTKDPDQGGVGSTNTDFAQPVAHFHSIHLKTKFFQSWLFHPTHRKWKEWNGGMIQLPATRVPSILFSYSLTKKGRNSCK